MLLRDARLVTPDGILESAWLAVDGDRIAGLGQGDEPADDDVVELDGATVVPGFVDIHCHGGDGAGFDGSADDVARAAAFHRRRGTTTLLASLITAPMDDLAASAETLTAAVRRGEIAGVHFEGPFLARGKCGAHDPELLRDPDPGDLARLLDAAAEGRHQITLAPELPGGEAAIAACAERGVVAAIGHTEADHARTRAAIAAGARHATHLYNAMIGLHHREPGTVGALLEDPTVTCELILDGHHVHDATARLTIGLAGADRVALITDATPAAGLAEGSLRFGTYDVVVAGGAVWLPDRATLAGSTMTMATAFRRAVQAIGVSLVDAVRMTATTPARVVGLDSELGSLRPGLAADLAVLDDDLEVTAVLRGGAWVH